MTDQDEMRKISLETYTVMKNIEKIKEFMFADLDKTIELARSGKGAFNTWSKGMANSLFPCPLDRDTLQSLWISCKTPPCTIILICCLP